ncbi:MAG: 3-phosphoglycerate dehydrogenase [Nitrososphaerota archaeon]|nr:3-phosphoglycerate dehydrogenase [Nitrososphaerota archaeon]MDG6970086.1 3-phosphoglycerate dehydrogenase [Nitrososphaerota archaeon]MDG6975634.1 3-phosphoglycerate dehydrogenase [Nitrososphaerota archaeon]MDG6981337.1 3-phosphoglycerate dehydrogenase [Nitrososphaerota archaeon]
MILSAGRLHPEARRILDGFGVVDASAGEQALAGCVAVIAWPSDIDYSILRRLPSIKVLQTISAGVDDLDFAKVPAGVDIYSNAGAYTVPAAEHAWALLLAAAKGVGVEARTENYILRGRTLLVLGCGAIGSAVAQIGKAAFGMRTAGVSRSFRAPEAFDDRRSPDQLEESIPEADAIVDALPLNKETRSVLGYRALSGMKRGAVLVNVGRAETVDEPSVERLLKERPETRYATDVFWRKGGKEDFSSGLWSLPNFYGTFHTAGGLGAEEALRRAEEAAAENLRLALTTGGARNLVDRSDY